MIYSSLINNYLSPFAEEADQYLLKFRQSHSAADLLAPLDRAADLKVLVIGEAISQCLFRAFAQITLIGPIGVGDYEGGHFFEPHAFALGGEADPIDNLAQDGFVQGGGQGIGFGPLAQFHGPEDRIELVFQRATPPPGGTARWRWMGDACPGFVCCGFTRRGGGGHQGGDVKHAR